LHGACEAKSEMMLLVTECLDALPHAQLTVVKHRWVETKRNL